MSKTFEEWFEKNQELSVCPSCEHDSPLRLMAAWNARQEEVDILKKEITSRGENFNKVRTALQKAIDAIELMSCSTEVPHDECIRCNALKELTEYNKLTKEDRDYIARYRKMKDKVSDNLINPMVLANAKTEQIHQIKPTGKKVKICKLKG